MRWPVLILFAWLAFALAGCMGAPDGPGTTQAAGTTQAPATTPEGPRNGTGPPLILEVFNTTIDLPAPGGSDAFAFEVPDGYLELFVATPGTVVLQGQVRAALTDPAGTEHVLLDGVYVQDGPGGAPATCPDPCTFRLEPVSGIWHLDAAVMGEMHLPLTGRAQ